MYGFVPYNISEIQRGIQFGHAVVEYGRLYGNTKDYKRWGEFDKTFIILNGGTTRDAMVDYFKFEYSLNFHNQNDFGCGGMQEIAGTLGQIVSIKFAIFNEPDLNFALSGICLLVDERVYDRTNYPTLADNDINFERVPLEDRIKYLESNYSNMGFYTSDEAKYDYKRWINSLGGQANEFLRYYLPKFKLA